MKMMSAVKGTSQSSIWRSWDALTRSAAVVVLGLVVIAVLGPALAPQDPNEVNLGSTLLGPSAEHWFGADRNGRDILSRLLDGAPATLLPPLVVVVLATAIGSSLGLLAAWRGGALDRVLSRAFDIVFAFPALLLAILAVAVFGAGLHAAVIALAIAYTPYLARLVRAVALRERRLPYIEALEVQGFSSWRINIRHLIPRLGGFVLAQATLTYAYALLDLAALSFLGLGAQPPTSDWGSMIAEGLPDLTSGYPAETLAASLMVVVTVCAFNVLGDAISETVEAT
jgi:peptide/nickel transport system permease protein